MISVKQLEILARESIAVINDAMLSSPSPLNEEVKPPRTLSSNEVVEPMCQWNDSMSTQAGRLHRSGLGGGGDRTGSTWGNPVRRALSEHGLRVQLVHGVDKRQSSAPATVGVLIAELEVPKPFAKAL